MGFARKRLGQDGKPRYTAYDALPAGDFRLLVETDIESGLRWVS